MMLSLVNLRQFHLTVFSIAHLITVVMCGKHYNMVRCYLLAYLAKGAIVDITSKLRIK